MSHTLCFSVRYLNPLCHARGQGGVPEWPPSPLRLFQALAASSAGRSNERHRIDAERSALHWLEQQQPPVIVADVGVPASARYRLYVPDNIGDKVAKSWSGGRGDNRTEKPTIKRTEKDIFPTHLLADDPDSFPAVQYLFPLPAGNCPAFETLQEAARGITHLGWGIDMVVGNAEILSAEQESQLPGARWQPAPSGGVPLRVPIQGTLDALSSRHEAFLDRISPEGFKPVPPLTRFGMSHYRRESDPLPPEWTAFSILKPDLSGFRPFEPLRRTRDVAGMVRHAVAALAEFQNWTPEEIHQFVHGKNASGNAPVSSQGSPERFSYLPLPSISAHDSRVGAIRRVLIAAPARCRDKIQWVQRALAHAELIGEQGSSVGVLTNLVRSDWVLKRYTEPARTWGSVTPVLLPGRDDRRGTKTEQLLWKSLTQAGFSQEILSQTKLEWRQVGYHPGTDLASRYLPPDNLGQWPRIHVRLEFPQEIPGPIAVGGGRFRGFGVLAALPDS